MASRTRYFPLVLSVLALAGCGSDDENEASCNVETQRGCDSGRVCEEVDGAEPACFAPVVIEGRVIDAASLEPIERARVAARDVNGALISRSIADTDAEGRYSIQIVARRNADGEPLIEPPLLRADAAGYATFPSGLRVAIAVDTTAGREQDGRFVIENGTTGVALDPLPNSRGLGTLRGKVGAAGAAGTLVVAGGASGIAARDGSFTIFNVPVGTTEVRGYKAGLALEPEMVTVAEASVTSDVVLSPAGQALARVSGDVSFVDARAQETSVVLVVASTFNAALARGEVPVGLRQFPVSGRYAFEDVPAGEYVVLAAFENDGLVRDPDTAIGGTAIQRISVGAGEVSVPGFKITGALEVMSPGATSAEPVQGTPSFTFQDDSSEDGYELVVYDTFGNEVWRNPDVPRVSGSGTVSENYGGPPLAPGYYQFRAISWRSANSGGRTYISATEDLKGVFIVQ